MNTRPIKQDKLETVDNLQSILNENKGIALFENHGIMSNEINEIRQKVRKEGVEVLITKNTLLSMALKNIINKDQYDYKIKGKIVAFLADNAIEAAGSSLLFSKIEKKLLTPVLIADKNGIIEGSKKINNIAKMRNQQGMIGCFIMVLKAPAIKLVKILEIIKKNEMIK